jgi:hypothetical protein
LLRLLIPAAPALCVLAALSGIGIPPLTESSTLAARPITALADGPVGTRSGCCCGGADALVRRRLSTSRYGSWGRGGRRWRSSLTRLRIGGRRSRHSGSGHFQRPVPADRLHPHGDLAMQGCEPEHVDLDVPYTRRQIQDIAAVLICVGDHLGGAVPSRYGSSGNELVGGPYGTAMLGRVEKPRTEHQCSD